MTAVSTAVFTCFSGCCMHPSQLLLHVHVSGFTVVVPMSLLAVAKTLCAAV
jgi:hypothetical protein